MQGFNGYHETTSKILCHDVCSSDVTSEGKYRLTTENHEKYNRGDKYKDREEWR